MTARLLVPVPRDGGSRCDPCALFESVFGLDPPRGVDFVDTTFTVPGELQPQGCPIHGVGCPSHCPVLRAAREWESNPASKPTHGGPR